MPEKDNKVMENDDRVTDIDDSMMEESIAENDDEAVGCRTDISQPVATFKHQCGFMIRKWLTKKR